MSAPAEITGYVVIGATRLADTGADYAAGKPTALSGLSLTWGRDGPQSQPEVGACTFTVGDREGDADFLGALKVGAPATVYATVKVDRTGSVGVDAAVDPGFASDLNWRLKASVPVVDDPGRDALAPPGHAAKLSLNGTEAVVPIAPFTAHPGGWIGVPRLGGLDTAGQRWNVTMRYRVGPIAGSNVATWQFRVFTDSAKQAGKPLGNWISFAKQANTYVTIGGYYTIPSTLPYDYWIGLAVTGDGPAWNTVTPAGLTWAQVPAGSWDDVDTMWLDEFHAIAPPVTYRRATVANGRITDLAASAVGDTVQVDVTASDWTADLANQNIGAVPWWAERLDDRANHITSYAPAQPAVAVDARCAAFLVSWVDVDNQPIYGLLQDLATTGDGVLWPRFGTLWIEDPDTRAALAVLGPDPASGLITVSGARGTTGGVVLDSCDVLRDGLTLEQTVEDVVTRVALTWMDQTIDPDTGQTSPTDVSLFVDADVQTQTDYGVRELAISTQLTRSVDGTAVANRKLARGAPGAWHANGLVWDTDTTAPNDLDQLVTALTMLDMSARVGLLLTVTDVPAWIPLGPDLSSYLEGGTYTYEDGRWILEAGLAPSGMSGASAKWSELDPGWSWQLFDPSVFWTALWGVGSSY